MKTTPAKNQNANRNLKPGTQVVSKIDGELGTVVQVCTYRRNGVDAWSYLVDMTGQGGGREIWHRGDLFLPTPPAQN